MRVREVELGKEKGLIVYLTEEERKDEKVTSLINGYKGQYRDVAIFLSGNMPMEGVLERLLAGGGRRG